MAGDDLPAHVPAEGSLLASTISFTSDDVGAPHLLLFHEGSMSVARLPGDGKYVVGRDPDVDIPIVEPSISRSHAVIAIEAGRATIMDLGSQNGTKLNGRLITEATRLVSGDVIGFGSTQLVFCRTSGVEMQQSVLDPEAFMFRLHAEVERSLRFVRPLTLLLLGRGDRGSSDELLVESVTGAARSMDTVARLDKDTLAVLMPERGEGTIRSVETNLFRVAQRADRSIRAGMASWPRDAVSADSLIDAARTALDRAEEGRLLVAEQNIHAIDLEDRKVIAVDPAMVQLFALAERLAQAQVPVLISGETGVGKELVARTIHQRSKRRSGPFVAVNCASLPEALAESELFGHAKGAFTGADQSRTGLIEAANGGTLFFDEIGEMTPQVQAKLLRTLEEKRLLRLGEVQDRPIDVRVIAATHRDLAADVMQGRFRRDLFYRLNVATLLIPPLRRRPREIPTLARHLLSEIASRAGHEPPDLSPTTLRVFATYPWPGNVRELRNVLERAVAIAGGPVIEPWMLPPELAGATEEHPSEPGPKDIEPAQPFRPLEEELRELERRRIEQALELAGGVQSHAAALLHVPLRTFYMKVKQHRIEVAHRPKDQPSDVPP